MTTRRILASSGGFVPGDRQGTMRPGPIVLRMLELTGQDRPKVCLVMTASGDDVGYLTASYEAFSALSCDVTHLALFTQPNADVEERICGSDVVWVGGGSVANLLALWRLHGVDDAMRAAWEGGTVLGGVSAGAICWHVGGTTDSFGPALRPVTDGLGLLPYGCGVHYDSEEQRRPLLHGLVGAGTLPTSFATDDGIGILYEGTEPVEVVVDRPDRLAAAYRVERTPEGVVEARLPFGRL
ncbi:MAG: Type 1 glutamine amidotransferase-like domain-containing protein [Actinomycetota bacterium]